MGFHDLANQVLEIQKCVNAIVLKYFNEQYPNYLSEVFDVLIDNTFQLRGTFQKLKRPFRKTN